MPKRQQNATKIEVLKHCDQRTSLNKFLGLRVGINPWPNVTFREVYSTFELVANIARISRFFTFFKYNLFITYKFGNPINPKNLPALKVEYDE